MAQLAELYSRGFEIGLSRRDQEEREKMMRVQREAAELELARANRRATPKSMNAFVALQNPNTPTDQISVLAADLFDDPVMLQQALSARQQNQAHAVDLERSEMALEGDKLAHETKKTEAAGGPMMSMSELRNRLVLRFEGDMTKVNAIMENFDPETEGIRADWFDETIGTLGRNSGAANKPLTPKALSETTAEYMMRMVRVNHPKAFNVSDKKFDDKKVAVNYERAVIDAIKAQQGRSSPDFETMENIAKQHGLIKEESEGSFFDRLFGRDKKQGQDPQGAVLGGGEGGSLPLSDDEEDFDLPAIEPEEVDAFIQESAKEFSDYGLTREEAFLSIVHRLVANDLWDDDVEAKLKGVMEGFQEQEFEEESKGLRLRSDSEEAKAKRKADTEKLKKAFKSPGKHGRGER